MNIPDYIVQNVAWVVIATVGGAIGTSAGVFAFKSWKARRWKGSDRRAESSILLEFLHRQEERDARAEDREARLVEALVENAKAMTGLRGVVEVQLVQCRDSCNVLHRRVDDVLRDGHVA